ncbi:MAG: glycosyltransferase family 9 protein [Sphingobacteriaceae bacterium]|nr:glycosyltransferase family 9 protein [Sphingobacteriaceae bacterium]
MENKPVYIISRTDSIGDVILTLPMLGLLKKNCPACKIIFLGKRYTEDVVLASEHVDEFLDYNEIEKKDIQNQIEALQSYKATHFIHVFPVKSIALLAKKAKIQNRIGTTNRLYHWTTCNRLISLSRKNSDLHETQLNIKLLEKIIESTEVSLNEIPNLYGFTKLKSFEHESLSLPTKDKFNIIIHPKSKGSALEWGLENFKKLIDLLPSEKYRVFISGTADDELAMKEFILDNPKAINISGKLSLQQFIPFIKACDALVAASTGPLHIASAVGIKAIGLFSSRRPIHPGRWKPVGINSHALVFDPNCVTCAKGKYCECIKQINPQQVVNLLENK